MKRGYLTRNYAFIKEGRKGGKEWIGRNSLSTPHPIRSFFYGQCDICAFPTPLLPIYNYRVSMKSIGNMA